MTGRDTGALWAPGFVGVSEGQGWPPGTDLTGLRPLGPWSIGTVVTAAVAAAILKPKAWVVGSMLCVLVALLPYGVLFTATRGVLTWVSSELRGLCWSGCIT